MAGTAIVHKYRVFCASESNIAYTWDTHVPTTCPNNASHIIDPSSITIVDSISQARTTVDNLSLTAFDDMRVTERTTLIDLKSSDGLSLLRNKVLIVGSSDVTASNGFIELKTSFNAVDSAELRTLQRSKYVHGSETECAITCGLSQPLVGAQTVKIGMFDENDGYYFKLSGEANVSACVMQQGIEAAVERLSWNADVFDGQGESYLNLIDWTQKHMFIIQCSGKSIRFKINALNSLGQVSSWLGHSQTGISITGGIGALPLTVNISNNGTTGNVRIVYVGGRSCGVIGKYVPIQTRTQSAYVFDKYITSSTNFVPIISVRKKHVDRAIKIVRQFDIDCIASEQMVMQVRVGNTSSAMILQNAVFRPLSDNVDSESAMEYDTTATNISGGLPIWTGLAENINKIFDELSEDMVLVVCARALNVRSGTLGVVMRWKEDW